MRKKNDYVIYYDDEAFTVTGSRELIKALKWVHSIGAEDISIYKLGKNFDRDSDDVEECYKRYWK